MNNLFTRIVLVIISCIFLFTGIYSFSSIPRHLYFSGSRNISADSRIDEVNNATFDSVSNYIEIRDSFVRQFIPKNQISRVMKSLFSVIWFILAICIQIPTLIYMESVVKSKKESKISKTILIYIHQKDGKKSSLCTES